MKAHLFWTGIDKRLFKYEGLRARAQMTYGCLTWLCREEAPKLLNPQTADQALEETRHCNEEG